MKSQKVSKSKKKMNFKLFTTTLLATAATAAPAEQDLGDALQAYSEDMPEHVQRRFFSDKPRISSWIVSWFQG